jgi:hypothetical protein
MASCVILSLRFLLYVGRAAGFVPEIAKYYSKNRNTSETNICVLGMFHKNFISNSILMITYVQFTYLLSKS